MRPPLLRNAAVLGLCAGCMALALAQGCVREVLSGSDPEARPGRLTGNNRRDSLVVLVPWMGIPTPVMLRDGAPVAAETVLTGVPPASSRYTMRERSGASAVVDARSRAFEDGSIEFAFEVVSLPPGLSIEVPVQLAATGDRPAVDVKVNGAPMKAATDDRSATVLLARDGATRITVIPRPAPVAVPPQTAKP